MRVQFIGLKVLVLQILSVQPFLDAVSILPCMVSITIQQH